MVCFIHEQMLTDPTFEDWGGGILNYLEECVFDEEMELAYWVQNITEPMQKYSRTRRDIEQRKWETPQTDDEKEETKKIEKWKTKPLHGLILRPTEQVKPKRS